MSVSDRATLTLAPQGTPQASFGRGDLLGTSNIVKADKIRERIDASTVPRKEEDDEETAGELHEAALPQVDIYNSQYLPEADTLHALHARTVMPLSYVGFSEAMQGFAGPYFISSVRAVRCTVVVGMLDCASVLPIGR